MKSWPPVLTLLDLAHLFGQPNEDAARRFALRNGIPLCTVGRRSVVLTETLLAFLKAREATRQARGATEDRPPKDGALIRAATALRHRSRRNLQEAARKLVGRVAENPKN